MVQPCAQSRCSCVPPLLASHEDWRNVVLSSSAQQGTCMWEQGGLSGHGRQHIVCTQLAVGRCSVVTRVGYLCWGACGSSEWLHWARDVSGRCHSQAAAWESVWSKQHSKVGTRKACTVGLLEEAGHSLLLPWICIVPSSKAGQMGVSQLSGLCAPREL